MIDTFDPEVRTLLTCCEHCQRLERDHVRKGEQLLCPGQHKGGTRSWTPRDMTPQDHVRLAREKRQAGDPETNERLAAAERQWRAEQALQAEQARGGRPPKKRLPSIDTRSADPRDIYPKGRSLKSR